MPSDNTTLDVQPISETVTQTVTHATGESMSIISLITEASLTVQLVMLLLLLASLVSWSIIISKSRMLRREKSLTKKFEKEFWAGGSMEATYNNWNGDSKRASGMSDVFVAG